MKLKIGQQFEVVEVLREVGYTDAFKVGGWTIAKHRTGSALNTLTNFHPDTTYSLYMKVGEEVKPVGRLTVTKVKNHE